MRRSKARFGYNKRRHCRVFCHRSEGCASPIAPRVGRLEQERRWPAAAESWADVAESWADVAESGADVQAVIRCAVDANSVDATRCT